MKFNGPGEIFSARFVLEYFYGPNSGDIAFLRLDQTPENITPLRLGAGEQSSSGNPFQAFEYPSVGKIEGVHALGEILDMVIEKGQRLLQLRSMELNQGYSGAPVWMRRAVWSSGWLSARTERQTARHRFCRSV